MIDNNYTTPYLLQDTAIRGIGVAKISNNIPGQFRQTTFNISAISLDRQCYPLTVSTNKL
jgi:hypothetical protein